jgi:hypothetical protein
MTGLKEGFKCSRFTVQGCGCELRILSPSFPRMNLHRLIKKCSFFLIKLAFFLASGNAHMKLHEIKSEPQNIEQEISNDEVWNRCT